MAVYRVEKTHDYTVMANHHLRDERLSLKAKGLLSLILSLPDDWDISIQGLATIVSDGIASVRSGIGELMETGYIQRELGHAEGGTFAGYVYTIHETPAAAPSCENRTTAPSCSFPTTENPTTGNRTQSSKDKLSTIPPIVPHEGDDNPSVSGGDERGQLPQSRCARQLPQGGSQGDEGDDNPSVSGMAADSSLCTREPQSAETPKRKRRATKSAPGYRPDTFARFWAAYPRGEDKQGAIAAWDELKPDDATLQAMSRALVRQKASEEWQRGIGIPYAVRWLRRRRWEDEIKAPAPPPESAGGDLPVWN